MIAKIQAIIAKETDQGIINGLILTQLIYLYKQKNKDLLSKLIRGVKRGDMFYIKQAEIYIYIYIKE